MVTATLNGALAQQMPEEGKERPCDAAALLDFEDDPFSHALDKVLGLDGSDVEDGDEDLAFDDLSFSGDPFGSDQVKGGAKCEPEDSVACDASAAFQGEAAPLVDQDEPIAYSPQEEPAVVLQKEAPQVAPPRPRPRLQVTQIAVDKPKRSLSAYNFFFKAERQRLLQSLPVRDGPKPRRSHGKMGFADMARAISTKWKTITPTEKMEYDHLSALDGERYEKEMDAWKKWEAMKEKQAQGNAAKPAAFITKSPSASSNKPPLSVPQQKTPASNPLPVVVKSSTEPVCNGGPAVVAGEGKQSKKRKNVKEASKPPSRNASPKVSFAKASSETPSKVANTSNVSNKKRARPESSPAIEKKDVQGKPVVTKPKEPVPLVMKPSKVDAKATLVSKKTENSKATAAKQVSEDASSETSEDSDDDSNIDSVLGKLDFDLLTFAEMLQDTSFSGPHARVVEDSDDETDDSSESDEDKKMKATDSGKPARKAKTEPEKKVAGNASVAKGPASKDEVKPTPVMSMDQLKKLTGKDSKKKIVRCLSAYNIFFKAERQKLLETLPARDGKKPRRSHGKMGFADMARTIAAKWKSISAEEKMDYEQMSALDCDRYELEKKELAAASVASTISDDEKSAASKVAGKQSNGNKSQDVIDLCDDDTESEPELTPVTPVRSGPEQVTLTMKQPYMMPPPYFYSPHMAAMMAGHMGYPGYPGFVSPMQGMPYPHPAGMPYPHPAMYGAPPPMPPADVVTPSPVVSAGAPEPAAAEADTGGGASMISSFLRKSLCKR